MNLSFGAYVTAALFDGEYAAFALGDGRVRWEDGVETAAHDGAVLCAAAHPSGAGILTGGDDGRLVWSRDGAAEPMAEVRGRWIDGVTASPSSGLIAFAAGRELHVRDAAAPDFARVFAHEKSVAALAFDAKGRRLAAATYGGVALWWARIAEQKPSMLRWAGSHVGVAFSPDARFVISAMQENAVHGWRLADSRDLNMGVHPAKVRSLAFVEDGASLAVSGANGVVLWPFAGANGPMGRQALEVGFDQSALVARTAGDGPILAAGLDDGRVWACDLATQAVTPLKLEKGAPITALAVKGSRIAWGDEAGEAGVAELPTA
jgi:WD40 repeat protein